MKVIKLITIFSLLFILGIFTSYANVKCNNWMDEFIQTFEKTDLKFKFYDIKINATLDNSISEKNIRQMCIDTIGCFKLNKDKIKWNKKTKKNKLNIYATIKDKSYSISFKAIQKNNKEYYIIVDILNNKVYKNIVDIYPKLNNQLCKYSSNVEKSVCIVGENTKNLQLENSNEILENILYNMSAKKVDSTKDNDYIFVTAYSNLLAENDLEYLENKINLNIGIRYSEYGTKTLIYMATPIIKLDY